MLLGKEAWEGRVARSDADSERQVLQDEAGCLWDLLYKGRRCHPDCQGRRQLARLWVVPCPAGRALDASSARPPEADGRPQRRWGAGHHHSGVWWCGLARLLEPTWKGHL